ncbi:hypothetical protein CDD83_322 [Cordyceps sp. RAO-2017]|nr:hypothetical protein CDD83_322 [Cordyceps sp. RAO-2017]
MNEPTNVASSAEDSPPFPFSRSGRREDYFHASFAHRARPFLLGNTAQGLRTLNDASFSHRLWHHGSLLVLDFVIAFSLCTGLASGSSVHESEIRDASIVALQKHHLVFFPQPACLSPYMYSSPQHPPCRRRSGLLGRLPVHLLLSS